MESAILLMRNPVSVLASYHKFLYRYEFGNGPEAKVPIDKWVAWRNDNYIEQLQKWVDHTKWWMEHYGAQGKLLIVPFEDLTDETRGPGILREIAVFLGQIDSNTAKHLAPEPELPCIWYKAIGWTEPLDETTNKPKRRPKRKQNVVLNPMTSPFTMDQLDTIMKAVKNLKREFATTPQLHDILGDYVKGITAAKRKVQRLLEQ